MCVIWKKNTSFIHKNSLPVKFKLDFINIFTMNVYYK